MLCLITIISYIQHSLYNNPTLVDRRIASEHYVVNLTLNTHTHSSVQVVKYLKKFFAKTLRLQKTMRLITILVISFFLSLKLKIGLGKEKKTPFDFAQYENWWNDDQNHEDNDDYAHKEKVEEEKHFFESFDYEAFEKRLAKMHPNKVKLYNQKLSSFQTIYRKRILYFSFFSTSKKYHPYHLLPNT